MEVTRNKITLRPKLAAHPFLSGIAPAYLDFITDCAMEAQFDKDEHILLENRVADKCFLIEKGEASIKTFLSPSQGFVTIEQIGVGDIVGWSWLVPPYHWHFSAFATIPTTTLVLDGARIRAKCVKDCDFGFEIQQRLLAVIGKRLRMMRQNLNS